MSTVDQYIPAVGLLEPLGLPWSHQTPLSALLAASDEGKDLAAWDRIDLKAYQIATAEMEMVSILPTFVHDQLKAIAIPDRIVYYRHNFYLMGIETGAEVHRSTIALMALAARGKSYDPAAKKRIKGLPMDIDRGLIVHIPEGAKKATVHWVNLLRGWGDVSLAHRLSELRKRTIKDYIAPVRRPDDRPKNAQAYRRRGQFDNFSNRTRKRFDVLAARAKDIEELRDVYTRAHKNIALTSSFKEACKRRLAELSAS